MTSGTLTIVATPIGNMGDISARAVQTLKEADLILCEDTRVSKKLAIAHGISTQLKAYHDHNGAKVRPEVLARLAADEHIALISDAGTPLISDPGYKLVREAVDAGAAVTAVPGPSAFLAAVCVAGLPSDALYFGGFLPPKVSGIETTLTPLLSLPATLVFYETPKRLPKSLPVLAAMMGARDAAICRELTKLHETVYRGTLTELADLATSDGIDARGEAVVVIGPPDLQAVVASEADIDTALKAAFDRGLSVKDAAADVARTSGLVKRDVYARALAVKDTL